MAVASLATSSAGWASKATDSCCFVFIWSSSLSLGLPSSLSCDYRHVGHFSTRCCHAMPDRSKRFLLKIDDSPRDIGAPRHRGVPDGANRASRPGPVGRGRSAHRLPSPGPPASGPSGPHIGPDRRPAHQPPRRRNGGAGGGSAAGCGGWGRGMSCPSWEAWERGEADGAGLATAPEEYAYGGNGGVRWVALVPGSSQTGRPSTTAWSSPDGSANQSVGGSPSCFSAASMKLCQAGAAT